jgi:RNA polymerase sigma-70 factor (ECF subfamily)
MSETLAEAGEPVLLARARDGDAVAFDELVSRHRQNVYMQAYAICRNEEDAMDLCQEAFVRAWRSLSAFDRQGSFGGWLRRIVTNAAIDLCRARNRRPQAPVADGMVANAASRTTPSGFERPGEGLERREVAQRVEGAFAELSPEHRAVIVLKEIEGLSYREIATATGCSVGTVMSRLFYARRRLQTLLADLRP